MLGLLHTGKKKQGRDTDQRGHREWTFLVQCSSCKTKLGMQRVTRGLCLNSEPSKAVTSTVVARFEVLIITVHREVWLAIAGHIWLLLEIARIASDSW